MSGHIRRRGERSWELKFDDGRDPATGKRRIRYVSFKGTKREAQIELTRLMAAHDKGDYIDPSKATVAQFLDRWHRDWAAINVGGKTRERYEELTSAHVKPHIGMMQIQKLQPVHLAELYAKLLREGNRQRGLDKITGLAPRTVGHVHRAIHKALNVAVEWGVVQRNVADVARPPKVDHKELEILSEKDARSLIEKLRGQPLYPIAVLGLATGMRRGELLALRWRDVDLDGGRLRVEQSLEQTKAGGTQIQVPENAARSAQHKPRRFRRGRATDAPQASAGGAIAAWLGQGSAGGRFGVSEMGRHASGSHHYQHGMDPHTCTAQTATD